MPSKSGSLSSEELERKVRESRTAQGLPPKVIDPAALSKVARLLTSRKDDDGR